MEGTYEEACPGHHLVLRGEAFRTEEEGEIGLDHLIPISSIEATLRLTKRVRIWRDETYREERRTGEEGMHPGEP